MKFLIVLLCLILTGCRIDYNLKITDKNKFVEKTDIMAYFPNGNSISNEPGEEGYDIAEVLRSDAREYLNTLSYSGYNLINIESTNYKGVRVSRTFDGAVSYNYNMLVKNLYDEFSVDLSDDIVTISAKGLNREKVESRYEMMGMVLDNSSINIELPYKVLENNADEVDKNKNIYTWNIDKNTTEKDILLKYDSSNVYALNMKTIGTKVNMTIVYVILVFLIIIIVGYFVYSYIKRIYENRNKF